MTSTVRKVPRGVMTSRFVQGLVANGSSLVTPPPTSRANSFPLKNPINPYRVGSSVWREPGSGTISTVTLPASSTETVAGPSTEPGGLENSTLQWPTYSSVGENQSLPVGEKSSGFRDMILV